MVGSRPHQRETNNDAGSDIAVLEEHSVSVRQTEQRQLSSVKQASYIATSIFFTSFGERHIERVIH